MRKLRQRLKAGGQESRTARGPSQCVTPLRKRASPPKPSFPVGPWKDPPPPLTTQPLTLWKDCISPTWSVLHTNDSVAHIQLTNSQTRLFFQAADTVQPVSLCFSSMVLFLAGGFTS